MKQNEKNDGPLELIDAEGQMASNNSSIGNGDPNQAPSDEGQIAEIGEVLASAKPEPVSLDEFIGNLDQDQNSRPERRLLDQQMVEFAKNYYYYNKSYIVVEKDAYIGIDSNSLRLRTESHFAKLQYDDDMIKGICNDVKILIQNARYVHECINIAGFTKGRHRSPDGTVYLVQNEANFPVPIKGDFPDLRNFLVGLLGEKQLEFLLGSVAIFVRHLWKLRSGKKSFWIRQPMPTIVIAGPPACGKTLLMELLKLLLGGRDADPYPGLCSSTNFNGDLIQAELHIVDDAPARKDAISRSRIASAIKNVYFSNSARIEKKYANPVMLPIHSILFFAINDTPRALMCMPVLDPSINDKITLLKASAPPDGFPEQGDKKVNFINSLKLQIPMLLHYLLNEHQIRPELADSRTGVKTYHNPEILEAMDDLSPEVEVLEMLFEAFQSEFYLKLPESDEERVMLWRGKSSRLLQVIEKCTSISRHRISQLLTTNNSLGHRLHEISISYPDIIVKGSSASQGTRTFEFHASKADFLSFMPDLKAKLVGVGDDFGALGPRHSSPIVSSTGDGPVDTDAKPSPDVVGPTEAE